MVPALRNEAHYLEEHRLGITQDHVAQSTARPQIGRFRASILMLLSLLTLASGLTLISVDLPTTAMAASCDDGDECDFDQGINDLKPSDPEDAMWEGGDVPTIDDGAKYIMWRLFRLGYINWTPKSKLPDGLSRTFNCNMNDPKVGTALYHNCDVPTLFTEFVQDMAALVIPEGPIGARQGSAFIGRSEGVEGGRPWGLSYYTPAVVNPDAGTKFTALEILGYNMKFTRYHGEWDRIKVYTQARALANFGTFDKLKLTVQSVLEGVSAQMSGAVDDIGEAISTGNMLKLATVPLRAVFSTRGAAAGAQVIIDTSDGNIFATNGWFRPQFLNTIYGARELSDDEISSIIAEDLLQVMLKNLPKNFNPSTDPDLKVYASIVPSLVLPTKGVCAPNTAGAIASKQVPFDSPINSAEICAQELGLAVTAVTYTPPQTLAAWKASVWRRASNRDGVCTEVKTDKSRETDLQGAIDQFTVALQCLGPSGEAYRKYTNILDSKRPSARNMIGSVQDSAQNKIAEAIANNFVAPANRLICLKDNGADMTRSGVIGARKYIYLFRDNSYNPDCLKNGKMYRAPIQNGLFGNGYDGVNYSTAQPGYEDPRREAFDPAKALFSIASAGDAGANIALTVSRFTTRVSNTALNLALSPTLTNLGITEIIATLVESLRDGIFYPLVVIMIGFSALVVFFNALRRRDFLKQLISLGLIALTFVLGVIVINNPLKTITAIDEAPAYLEAAIVGTIFSGSSNGELCTSSDPMSLSENKDLNGKAMSFSPKASSRTLLCENWKSFLFNPYVFSQWGTSYTDLYSNGNAPDGAHEMKNTNEQLVGDAEVKMGAGISEKNWAFYQLRTMFSGTTTTPDTSNPSGGQNRDFYRVIDMQLHPDINGGAFANKFGTGDDTYFDQWSGGFPGARMITAMLGTVMSVFGMVLILSFTVLKIQINIMVLLLILFAPFMLLWGLHPTSGRTKLKSYFAQLVSLSLQRIMLTVLLAVMLRIVSLMTNATDNFLMYFILVMVACGIFTMYRKELLDLFTKGPTNAWGSFSNSFEDPAAMKSSVEQMGGFGPRSLRQWTSSKTAQVGGAVSGAVGGFVVGGVKGAGEGAKMNSTLFKQRQDRRNRIAGLGGLQTVTQAHTAGKETGQKKAEKYRSLVTDEYTASDYSSDPDSGSGSADQDAVADAARLADVIGTPEGAKPKHLRNLAKAGEAIEKRNKSDRNLQEGGDGLDRERLDAINNADDVSQEDFLTQQQQLKGAANKRREKNPKATAEDKKISEILKKTQSSSAQAEAEAAVDEYLSYQNGETEEDILRESTKRILGRLGGNDDE